MVERHSIRFLRCGKLVELTHVPPMQTVLEYLRLEEKSKGTKEGCNEGDCGACTVALGRVRAGKLVYEPANACIMLVAQLDGCDLVVVDDLANGDQLHPVQQAMVNHHGSQCGFCTPGFIMALFTLYHAGHRPTRAEIVDHIAGNLCRCTGYRPIVAAAEASCRGRAIDAWARDADITARTLDVLQGGIDVFIGDDDGFVAIPAHEDQLAMLASRYPEATLVAGATDVGLWITKQMRTLPKLILVKGVSSLHAVEDHGDLLSIGAAATYAEAEMALAAIDPDVGEVMRRIGSKQVRAAGTIGGNIANGSPIGDMPPMLIALGATLHLRRGRILRAMPLENFFLEYGKQDRKPGELVWRIDVPKLGVNVRFRAYKISKRFDQDISAVLGAFRFRIESDGIVEARVAFGGVAGIPQRASAVEQALVGVIIENANSWEAALAALEQDFRPLSDMRASSAYRMDAAKALLKKALLEMQGGGLATRVVGMRETEHGELA
jgi:xanthine dehydrogenase small subunit